MIVHTTCMHALPQELQGGNGSAGPRRWGDLSPDESQALQPFRQFLRMHMSQLLRAPRGQQAVYKLSDLQPDFAKSGKGFLQIIKGQSSLWKADELYTIILVYRPSMVHM